MKTRFVVSPIALPAKLPLWNTVTAWLALDHFNSSDLARGIVWTVVAFIWIATIICIVREEKVDPFELKSGEAPMSGKSRWKQRMEELTKQ